MPEEIDTLSIIRALPFEKVETRINLKTFLLNTLDSAREYTDDDKLEMEQIIWTAYAAIAQLKTEENLILAAFQRGINVTQSEQLLPADVAAEVYKQTRQEMKADEWPDAPLSIVAETARKLMPYILRRFKIPGVNSPALAPKQEESKTIIDRADVPMPSTQRKRPSDTVFEKVTPPKQQPPPPQQPKKKHWWQR